MVPKSLHSELKNEIAHISRGLPWSQHTGNRTHSVNLSLDVCRHYIYFFGQAKTEMKKDQTCQNCPHLGVPSATSSESREAPTWERERGQNPYFLGCLDFGVQLVLCPWGFLNHLRGTADRFLLAPACALPGIRRVQLLVAGHVDGHKWGCGLAPAKCSRLASALPWVSQPPLGLSSLQPGLPGTLWGGALASRAQMDKSNALRPLCSFTHGFNTRARHGAGGWEYRRHRGTLIHFPPANLGCYLHLWPGLNPLPCAPPNTLVFVGIITLAGYKLFYLSVSHFL